jgi:hypothetical protein
MRALVVGVCKWVEYNLFRSSHYSQRLRVIKEVRDG